jgi:hypothetical protein
MFFSFSESGVVQAIPASSNLLQPGFSSRAAHFRPKFA